MSYERSAGAIIFYQEEKKIEYLILRYTVNYWGFPKGHVEKGESDRETAKREIYEETGIKDLTFISGFGKKARWSFKRGSHGEVINKEAIFYLGQSKTKKVKLSYEHNDYLWMPFDEAIKIVSFDNMKTILKEADDWLKIHYSG